MLLLALFVLAYSDSAQLDINKATRQEIMRLPVDSVTAERIWERIDAYGRLNSIYELLQIPGITPEKFEELKPLIMVTPREWGEYRQNTVQRIQRRLAAEDGPTTAAVEEWQDLLLSPININKARIDDLLVLDRVSLVDAVAVAKFLRAGGKISGRRDLAGQVPGLSSYGYRNMRDFVTYNDSTVLGFGGNYRVAYETDPKWDTQADLAMFSQALAALRDSTIPWEAQGIDTAFFRERLLAESAYVAGMRNKAGIRHRLRVRAGRHIRIGAWAGQKLYSGQTLDDIKGFASVQDIGPIRRLFVGDYRLALGQGLLVDNNSELRARTYDRAEGLFSYLTENPGFGMRGVATELGHDRLGLIGFFSRTRRDAILNPDSSVNYYMVATPRFPSYRDVLTETDWGGSVRFDLGSLLFAPIGTRLALNLLGVGYDRSFRPDARFLDVPADAETLDDPNYAKLDTGMKRLFVGADLRTVVENVSLEAELAAKPRIDSAAGLQKGLLVKARTQYDYLTLTGLFRHYDVGYDNPYNRGFCEQLRFEDTPLEKSYRVIDPAFIALQDFPIPKAEQGLFFDARYQIGRQVTFTRVYLDVWRNLAWGADNVRFQGEVEYLPVYPVRLRFKQKIQAKELPKVAGTTRSVTLESTIRAMTSLSNWDYLTGEVRLGKVLLTPTMRYGDNASMWGDFVSVQWEHNFSDDFNTELGIAVWQTNSMSQWAFEDQGIDFLDGQGVRWYAAVTDRISDNLLLYFKFRHKVVDFAHTGLGSVSGLHYRGSAETVRDFVSRQNSYDISLQLDLLW